MASEQQVRQYLAAWFQLGKKVVLGKGTEKLLPQPVIKGDRYSAEFEECWQRIIAEGTKESYLEGTDETVAQLLAPEWELILCSRCVLPIPVPTAGLTPTACPCFDLSNWPNTDLPRPRQPVNSQARLQGIQQRLLQRHPPEDEPAEDTQAENSPAKDTLAKDSPAKNNSQANQDLPGSREVLNPPIPLDLPLCQCPVA